MILSIYCEECEKPLLLHEIFYWYPKSNGQMVISRLTLCEKCFKKQNLNTTQGTSEAVKIDDFKVTANRFNEPEHYHQHKIDTLTFLQEGFPPEMAMGFIAGNIIKYIQRYPYKDGKKDLAKAVDYAKRFIAFVEEKDLLK